MSVNEVHKNDIGTIFRVTVKDGSTAVDVSSATSKKILFKNPSGTVLKKDADFYTDGTDGIIQYVAQSGDLDDDGTWYIQAYVVLSDGTWYSDFQSFTVYRNIGAV